MVCFVIKGLSAPQKIPFEIEEAEERRKLGINEAPYDAGQRVRQKYGVPEAITYTLRGKSIYINILTSNEKEAREILTPRVISGIKGCYGVEIDPNSLNLEKEE